MSWRFLNLRFESRVVLDGSQTDCQAESHEDQFESRVVLDGSQTSCLGLIAQLAFESRVVLDGSQTRHWHRKRCAWFESRVVLDGSLCYRICKRAAIYYNHKRITQLNNKAGLKSSPKYSGSI